MSRPEETCARSERNRTLLLVISCLAYPDRSHFAAPFRFGALLVALVASLSACGDSDVRVSDRSESARFNHLVPGPGRLASGEHGVRRYRRLTPTPDEPWVVEHARAKYVPVSGSEETPEAHSLRLIRAEQPTITIPGPFDASAFSSLALRVELGRVHLILLRFLEDGEWVEVNHTVPEGMGDRMRVIIVDSPELARIDGEVAELQLRVFGETGYVRLDWIDFLQRSPGSFFPDPTGGPAMIDLGWELRAGVGVTTTRPVEVRFDAPARGVLQFAFGLPPRWSGAPPEAELQLVLTGAAGEIARHRWPLDPKAAPQWHTVRLPIPAAAGELIDARWEVTGAGEVACAVAEIGAIAEKGTPRRVLLITSDTHRSDHLGVARRGVEVRTPTLDALAERGIFFEDCFSTSNLTNPSHIALMTATHPRDTGILENNQRMGDAAATLAEAFQSAGFATWAAVSSDHLGHAVSGIGQGFDRMSIPVSGAVRDAEDTVDVIVDWLDESEGVPAFIWLHLFDAHTPYDPPPAHAREYYPDRQAAFDPSMPPPADVPVRVYERDFPGLKDLEYPEAMYRGEVTYLDRELGRLFGLPALQEAIIAFTADHGESLGQHDIYYAHADLYPDSIHVPLILCFPGGSSGLRCSTPVRQLDLGRTLLDLAGSAGIEFPGSNLLSVLDSGVDPRGARFALSCRGRSASITEDGWHLMFYLQPLAGENRRGEVERHSVALYFLPDDPGCLHNRLESEPNRVRRMRRTLIDWLLRAEDRGWRGETITTPETLRQLGALGYTVGGDTAPPAEELYDPSCKCALCSRFR